MQLPDVAEAALATDRLILRPFTQDDLPIYAQINTDPQVMRYLGGPISQSETLRQMLWANRCWRESGIGKIAIERRSDGALLGMCGLSHEHWYPHDLEIGWRLAPAHWGHGYATEAALAWRDHALQTLNAHRIISIADSPNIRSIAVMERLGMTLDHTARLSVGTDAFDAVIYRIADLPVRQENA